jgi:membrane protease YdiL (CAAX protease family)
MNKTIRNLIIFTAVTLTCGFLGIALDRLNPPQDPLQGLGALVWLVSPLATVLVLRAFGGDGWQDFGIKLNLRASWMWYVTAVLIIPLITLLTLTLGVIFGAISLTGFETEGFHAFLSLMGVTFVSVMVKNIFEEFAWRGYLTPRFEALRLNPFLNHILTGLIWAGWHVPYYLYFLNRDVLQSHTPLSLSAFILLTFILLPLQAIAFGELRLLSNSVWPVWLMHNIANAISLPLLSYGFVKVNGGLGVLLSPGMEGIVYTTLLALAGIGLYKYRVKNTAASKATAANLPVTTNVSV